MSFFLVLGIPRLVRLCKDEKERNCSDSVLIACLAALRKVTAKCGKDVLAELEAEELIDMKLLENFKKYSTDNKHENVTLRKDRYL